MPLLRRLPFEKEKPPAGLKPSDEVFHCKVTNEIFTDYEQFFERVILCNSLVWSCEITGRSGLTYQEALDSEEKSRKQMTSFPETLQKPVLYLASLCNRRRLIDMNDDIYGYVKGRYFVGEQVDVMQNSERKSCKVIRAMAPDDDTNKARDTDSDVICLDTSEDEEDQPRGALKDTQGKPPDLGPDPSLFQYLVQDKKKTDIYIIGKKSLNRKKGVFTREKCKMFLKINCESSGHSIWTVKESAAKKLKLVNIKFEDLFDGPKPIFPSSKPRTKTGPKSASSSVIDLTEDEEIAKAKAARKERKKKVKEMKKQLQKKESKEKIKEKAKQKISQSKPTSENVSPVAPPAVPTSAAIAPVVEKPQKLTPEEMIQLREQLKLEREAARLAKKEETKRVHEEEKLRRKEERDKEREMKKEAKLQQEENLRQWNKPRDDLECDDLKDLPLPTPVSVGIPAELFGDVMLVLEYLHNFKPLLDTQNQFPSGIALDELTKGLTETNVNGVFFDLLSLLLTTLFNLQNEEEVEEEEWEEEEDVKSSMPEGFGKADHTDLVKQATKAAQLPQMNYATSLSQLPVDPQTITEVLRLHLLGSGSRGSEGSVQFRYQQRGAYTSCDDPGLDFRRDEAEILEFLGKSNVFDLSPRNKLKVLCTLIQQVLTYAACRDNIEEAFEKLRQTRQELRLLLYAEQKRDRDEQTFWYRRRLEERAKGKELEAQRKEQKKKELEEKLRAEEKKDLSTPAVEQGEKMDVDDAKVTNHEIKQDDKENKTEEKKSEEKKSEESKTEEKKTEEIKESSRRSARQKNTKDKVEDAMELLSETTDFEKITPEERERVKACVKRKEQELLKQIEEMQHGFAIYPIGRDRTFRRYWVFRSIPGVYVEDCEEYMPDDFLQPVMQKDFHKNDLSKDEKSTGSDKENESFDDKKKDAFNSVLTEKPLLVSSLDNQAEVVDSVKEKIEEAMDTDIVDAPAFQNVYEQIKCRNTHCWAFYQTEEQMEHLIASLNPRGFREGPLRQALSEQKTLLLDAISHCPINLLNIEHFNSSDREDKAIRFQNIKNRNRVTQGAVKNASAQEFLELSLRETILDIEDRLYAGTLGALKVKNRELWRSALEEGSYDSQCDDIPSSPSKRKLMNGHRENDSDDECEDMETQSGSEAANCNVVLDLSRALVQVARGIDPKYLNPPLGEEDDKKKFKQKTAIEKVFRSMRRKASQCDKDDSDDGSDTESEDQSGKSPVESWEESLLSGTSLSQIFLHLAVLEGCVTWTKSALSARCRICRRKGDGEHMLLCDGCDRGHHMYCLKPPVKNVPRGDWFCLDCRPKDILRTPRKRRLSTMMEKSEDEDSSDNETSEEDGEEESNSEVDESQEEDSDDEDSSDESNDSSSEDDSSEEEKSPQPAKIKLLRGMGRKKQPQSGRSTPTSVTSGRSRSSGAGMQAAKTRGGKASEPPKGKSGRTRHSLESSQPSKGKARSSLEKPVKSRHSIESSRPSRNARPAATKENASKAKKPSSRRASSEAEEEPAAKKAALAQSRSRGGENVVAMKKCEELTVELSQRSEAWPFLKPVNRKDAPDYFDHVRKPMDFSTMRNKINKFEYQEPEEVLSDMRVIFKNCEDYNMPTAPEYQAGQKMSRFFEKRCRELKLTQFLQKPKPQKSAVKSPKKSSPSPKKKSPEGRRSTRGRT